MKKIKLLTSLGAVSALGGGVALTTTSCSNSNDKSNENLFGYSDTEDYLPTYKEEDGRYKSIDFYLLEDGHVDTSPITNIDVDYDKKNLEIYIDHHPSFPSIEVGPTENSTLKEGDEVSLTLKVSNQTGRSAKQTIKLKVAENYYHSYPGPEEINSNPEDETGNGEFDLYNFEAQINANEGTGKLDKEHASKGLDEFMTSIEFDSETTNKLVITGNKAKTITSANNGVYYYPVLAEKNGVKCETVVLFFVNITE